MTKISSCYLSNNIDIILFLSSHHSNIECCTRYTIIYNYHNQIFTEISMRRLTVTTIGAFNTSYIKNKKMSETMNLYNQNMSFTCNDYSTRFNFGLPNFKIGENGKLYLKTSKGFIIKYIHKDDKWVKGKTYTGLGLRLKQLGKLALWDFRKDSKLVIGDEFQGMEFSKCFIQPENKKVKDQQPVKEHSKKTKKQPEIQQKLIKQTSAENPPAAEVGVKFKFNHIQFQMQEAKFESLQTAIFESISQVYGVNLGYQMELQYLMKRFENGEIQDQEQAEYNSFRL